MAMRQPELLEVVELRVESDGCPAGSVGTVVEKFSDSVMVEISDDRGHGVGFPVVSYEDVTRMPRAGGPRHA